MENAIKPNDPRLITQEELDLYAEELQGKLNAGLYDVRSIFTNDNFRNCF